MNFLGEKRHQKSFKNYLEAGLRCRGVVAGPSDNDGKINTWFSNRI